MQEYENESGQTVTLTNAQYLALLSARGVEELEQYAETLAFGSKINTNANLKYGTDYDLGDRVTCSRTNTVERDQHGAGQHKPNCCLLYTSRCV